MPKKSAMPSGMLDLSHLSKSVKMLKGYQVAPTSPSGSAQSSSSLTLDLEDGSEMTGKGKNKPKKDPMAAAEESITKAIEKAIESAEMQINRKLIAVVLKERIRTAINQKFHGRLSPADIDRFSQDAARGASYELGNLKVIPPAFWNSVEVDLSKKDVVNHTEEPDADVEIED